MELQAELLVDSKCGLGEGIQWSVKNQRLYWVDIDNAQLFSCDENGDDVLVKDLPERLCSFAFDPDGNMVCAFESGIYRYHSQTDQRDLLAAFEPDISETRLNDGRCDRNGRFVAGGYSEGNQEAISSVVSFDRGQMTTLIKNVACSNSIGFARDGKRMYFADTMAKDIFYFKYNNETGDLSDKTLFATLTEEEGVPDGSVVDSEDALWNAQFSGGRVQRFLSDGTRDICVRLSVPNITCACFGGKKLDKLFITTARHKMTEDEISTIPLSGGVFFVSPGVCGIAESEYGTRLF